MQLLVLFLSLSLLLLPALQLFGSTPPASSVRETVYTSLHPSVTHIKPSIYIPSDLEEGTKGDNRFLALTLAFLWY